MHLWVKYKRLAPQKSVKFKANIITNPQSIN